MINKNKILKTDRLILRRWRDNDYISFFKFAQEPDIAYKSGWFPHSTPKQSLDVIKNVYLKSDTFAITYNNDLIGSINLFNNKHSTIGLKFFETELGYWIGKPYWNKGFATEAAKIMLEYAFSEKNKKRIYACSTRDNVESKNVQRKCGFSYYNTFKNESIKAIKYNTLIDVFKLERNDYELSLH